MSRRINVTMGDDFYAALCAYAAEQECSPASLCLRGAKAVLSKAHRWRSGTRGRYMRQRAYDGQDMTGGRAAGEG